MSPKQFPVKMESKKDSSDPSWKVVGGNDGRASPVREVPVANTTVDDKASIAEGRFSPFVRAAKELPEIYESEDIAPDYVPTFGDLKMPNLPRYDPTEDQSIASIKRLQEVIEKMDPMDNAIVKVFYSNKKLFGFPLIVGHLLDESTSHGMVTFSELHNRISAFCDDAMTSRKYKPMFLYDERTNFGSQIDLRIDSFDEELGEFHLSDMGYIDSICASYHKNKKIVFHVHCHDNPFFDYDPKMNEYTANTQASDSRMKVNTDGHVKNEDTFVKRENGDINVPNSIPNFRRSKVDYRVHLNNPYETPGMHNKRHGSFQTNYRPGGLNNHNFGSAPQPGHHATAPSNQHSSRLNHSPISIYNDDDYLVQDNDLVIPFSQESKAARVIELQNLAMTYIPDVSSIIKLLKSHNVAFKSGDNASTWYVKFHNFTNIVGVYLVPPKAMEKNNIMGKEWNSRILPTVLYDRQAKMTKVLSHIITSPDFFPIDMQDELQLNPDPYNFLRLFMANHSHSVPELSDRVI